MTYVPEPEFFDIRIVLRPGDELFELFGAAKENLGIKSNAEAARMLIKKGCEYLKKVGL